VQGLLPCIKAFQFLACMRSSSAWVDCATALGSYGHHALTCVSLFPLSTFGQVYCFSPLASIVLNIPTSLTEAYPWLESRLKLIDIVDRYVRHPWHIGVRSEESLHQSVALVHAGGRLVNLE